MAPRVNRGEIWLYTFQATDKRRPVLVLSRQRAISPHLVSLAVGVVSSGLSNLTRRYTERGSLEEIAANPRAWR